VAGTLTVPGVWSAKNTSPAEIEAALLQLMHERYNDGMLQAPARVLNLVVIADHAARAETAERLEQINDSNPARTILIVVDDGREGLDATAKLVHETPDEVGCNAVFREQIEIECGARQLAHLDTIVHPILESEVGTVVWSPHGHPEAVDSLRGLASTVLIDSLDQADWREAIARIREIAEHAEVCDLAWLRSTPWRERVAGAFDPALWRPGLDAIERVTVRIQPGSTMAALLLVGWLASRLQWQPHVIDFKDSDADVGHATGAAGQIEIRFEDDPTMPVPGLAGLTIETSGGLILELNRGAGGLRALRTLPDGTTHDWTVIGASRGEDGILAHGITQAMFPDDLFDPALDAACAFGGRASIVRRSTGDAA
jgi:glucose-6-phosphate dehydrogenase assembly protein OpcA